VMNYITGSGKDIVDFMLTRSDGMAFTGSKDVGLSALVVRSAVPPLGYTYLKAYTISL